MSKRFQFAFLVARGMSTTESYRMAVRRAVLPSMHGTSRLELRRPEALELLIHPTVAGRTPIRVVHSRDDFVTLMQALTFRNEPEPVPPARAEPPLSGRAFVVLRALIRACASRRQEFRAQLRVRPDDLALRARVLVALASCRLEDLPSADVLGYLRASAAT
jgi:hypothetical protein